MENTTFTYNNMTYNFCFNPNDESGVGCVREIVTNNEYRLENFRGYKNKHFIDIGANCGVATIILAKQNPESTIYSYEPDFDTFQLLKKNVEVNGLTNVKIFNKAMSDSQTKSILLTKHPLYSGGNTTHANADSFKKYFKHFGHDGEIQTTEVQCTSLDQSMKEFDIQEVQLLKIDCEGAEYKILYDSEYLKERKIFNMVGEFHNLRYNATENNNIKLLEYCKKYVPGLVKMTMLTI